MRAAALGPGLAHDLAIIARPLGTTPNLPSLLAQRPLEASTLATGRKNLAVSELAQAARERAVKLALVQLAAPVAPVFERVSRSIVKRPALRAAGGY
jgi:hypothetical protein